jgi:hypothetical protein
MSTSENPALERLRGIASPAERAARSQAWIVRGRDAIKAAQQIRDDAFRAAHRDRGMTIDDIAALAQVKRNVVVHALRSNRERV